MNPIQFPTNSINIFRAMFLFFHLLVLAFGAAVVNARINFGGNSNDLQFTSSSGADSCVDTDGIRRQNGEEWTVRQHFVLICHEVPSGDAFFPKMRVEVIGCLREDGQTRMAIGEQVQDDGKTLVCRREGQGPTGEVRREWQLAPGRRGFSTIGSTVPGGSSSISTFGTAGLIGGGSGGGGGQFDNTFASNSNDERGCFNRAIGERWQRRSFELECTSQYELPKLVACIPPELNGQRIPAGGSLNVGRFTVVCLNRPDGSYGYRYV